jgi:hypothetical protein
MCTQAHYGIFTRPPAASVELACRKHRRDLQWNKSQTELFRTVLLGKEFLLGWFSEARRDFAAFLFPLSSFS